MTIHVDIPIEEAFVTLADDIARTDPRLGERIRALVQRLPLEGTALSTWRTLDRLDRRIVALEHELRTVRDAYAHLARVVTTMQQPEEVPDARSAAAS